MIFCEDSEYRSQPRRRVPSGRRPGGHLRFRTQCVPGRNRIRVSSTCCHLCGIRSSDRVHGVLTCRCLCSACSCERLRVSITCWHLCSTRSSDRVCVILTCRCLCSAHSSERTHGAHTCRLLCGTSPIDRICGTRACRYPHSRMGEEQLNAAAAEVLQRWQAGESRPAQGRHGQGRPGCRSPLARG